MPTAEERIQQLAIELPAVAKAVGVYAPAMRIGQFVVTSGQIPTKDGRLTATGKVPGGASLEAAQAAARQAVLNALAAVREQIGSLDEITQIVRLNVFVNSAAGFSDQAAVADGASELLLEVFGEVGRHTRCAVGAAELPLNAPVELDLIVEVR